MSRVEQFENIRCKMRKHFLYEPISSFTKVTDDSWCVRQSAIERYTGFPTCLLKLKKEIKGGLHVRDAKATEWVSNHRSSNTHLLYVFRKAMSHFFVTVKLKDDHSVY